MQHILLLHLINHHPLLYLCLKFLVLVYNFFAISSSNFKEKPESFDNYPSELTGDQILINSGRIIISAKESEMIFYLFNLLLRDLIF